MNSLERVFKGLAEENRCGLIPFSVAGFPDMDESENIFAGLMDADILEFGFPFSDPIADGPVIQAAAEHAIRKGITMAGALNRIRKLRESSDTPIVFFSYFNPIHKYGQDRFIAEAVESGVNALLITDMPPEESNGLKTRAEKAGMAWIHLITPTTPRNRILQLDASGSGFLYYVSVLGVTGARENLPENLAIKCDEIRSMVHLPLAVGFGISGPAQAAALRDRVDAVVVGSAIVSMIQRGVWNPTQWVAEMKRALMR